jgi:sporulation protein YlmC with PRC-barrel domain
VFVFLWIKNLSKNSSPIDSGGKKMEIPLNAQVECTDGFFGHSEYVLINPVIDKVTHLVVKQAASPNTEYNVPADLVAKTIDQTLHLNCTKAELEKMAPFIQAAFIKEKVPEMNYGMAGEMRGAEAYLYLPFVTYSRTAQVDDEPRQIPVGELTVQRGSRVEATDGYVGKVDEFVLNPESTHITHLVMREGHPWGKRDMIIPVSAMRDTHDGTVFLKLDQEQIVALPAFPLHRRWA